MTLADLEKLEALHAAGDIDPFPVTAKALRESLTERDEARAEVERLKGKLLEEARWVYDTGQRDEGSDDRGMGAHEVNDVPQRTC